MFLSGHTTMTDNSTSRHFLILTSFQWNSPSTRLIRHSMQPIAVNIQSKENWADVRSIRSGLPWQFTVLDALL